MGVPPNKNYTAVWNLRNFLWSEGFEISSLPVVGSDWAFIFAPISKSLYKEVNELAKQNEFTKMFPSPSTSGD